MNRDIPDPNTGNPRDHFDYLVQCETLFKIPCLAKNYQLGMALAQKIVSEDHLKDILTH